MYTPEIITPFGYVRICPVPYRDGYLVQAPVSLPALSAEWNAGDNATIDDGRFIKPTGEIHSTSKTIDSGGNGGIWDDAWSGSPPSGAIHVTSTPTSVKMLDPQNSHYAVFFPANTGGAGATVTAASAVTGFPHLEILIHRSFPAVTGTDIRNWATQITFGDYSLQFNYDKKVALYYLGNEVQSINSLGKADAYCKISGNYLRVRLMPDEYRDRLVIEVGEGHFLVYTFSEATPFPTNFTLTMSHFAGSASYQVWQVFHTQANIKATYQMTQKVDASSTGYFAINSLTATKRGVNVNPDNVSVSLNPVIGGDGNISHVEADVTVSNDYDMPEGSSQPANLVDGTIIIPSIWLDHVPDGTETPFIETLPTKGVHHISVLDDNNRMFSSHGSLTVSNRFGYYSGGYKRRAVAVWLSNDGGINNFLQCEGVTGGNTGIEFGWEGTPYVTIPYTDNSQKMLVPLGQRVIFDGWEISCAVRFLLERGNIDWTRFTSPGVTFPYWYTPHGVPETAPYAPATEDVADNMFVLGRGTGLNPRYEFQPDAIVWDVLLSLVQEMSDPYTGAPYMMGFDYNGNFRFQPFEAELSALAFGVKACFDTYPQGSVFNTLYPSLPMAKIRPGLKVTNNVDWMRSDITFQGLDTLSNELIQGHRDMPAYVKEALGWRSIWCERKGAWSSQEYIEYLLNRAQYMASLPTQVVVFPCSLAPFLYVGDCIACADKYQIGGAGLYTIIRIEHIEGVVGSGIKREGETVIFARLLRAL